MTDDAFMGDRTIIRPRPGRSAPGPAAGGSAPASGGSVAPDLEPTAFNTAQDASPNALLNAAAALFGLVSQLRGSASHPDIDGLREKVASEVRRFEQAANHAGVKSEDILAARYALCTLIDETVLSTPWGSGSVWSQEGMLSTFHNETWGGEKFFAILEQKSQAPAKHLDLLELYYVCMTLGLEGKYHVLERGQSRLEEVRENLYQLIRAHRGEFERGLSPHWLGVRDQRNALSRHVPLWVVGAIVAALLLLTYVIFRVMLGNQAEPVHRGLAAIDRKAAFASPVQMPVEEAAPVEPKHILSRFLQAEIDNGLVTVDEGPNGALVTLIGKGLFRSASDKVRKKYLPLLNRIGEALNDVSGQVQVIGHTDNVPIRSLRFQSNWDLSRARAASVLKLLAKHMDDPSRLTPEGRADTDPLVPNDSPRNRARNRRVDIAVTYNANY
ncbi:MAG TPA: type VI secretion system protein TssL [Chromatiaceae bacterium]|nr:type VI secretion system protein TssL [Chromatiaceae bacterium]